MGGANTEVNDGTTSVLLEAANFNFLSIRRTGGLLKLSSEAGSRFGKRVHPELKVQALACACELLAEVAGGVARPIYGDVYPGKPQPRNIELYPTYVNRLLGAEIPVEEMVRIWRRWSLSRWEMVDWEKGKSNPDQTSVPVHQSTNLPTYQSTISTRHRSQPPPGRQHPR